MFYYFIHLKMTSLILSSAIIRFFSAILSFFSIVSMWIVFKKAWRKWRESIVPVRNIFVLFKIVWKKNWFYFVILPFIILLFSLSSRILSFYNRWHWITNLFNDTIYSLLNLLFPFALILSLVFVISANLHLAKKFWKSAWFWLWLLFLLPIFLWILAFGNSKFEWIEFVKKYNLKRWILITILIWLLVGCCDAYLKYKLYNPILSVYEYKIWNKDWEVKTTTYDWKKWWWMYENGKKVWHWIEYKIWVKWEWDYNVDGEREWEWKITTEDWKQWWWIYKNGKEIWEWTIYWHNWMKFIGRFDNDWMKQWEWKSYYSNENLFEIWDYKDWEKIWEWTYYREDGTSTKLIFKDWKAWEWTEITSRWSEKNYKDWKSMISIKVAN